MSVLAVFRWKGDPDALLAAYDRELQHAVPREQPRRVTHICARSDNEVVIVDLWETEKDLVYAFDLPGVSLDQISIELHDDMLTVSADRERTEERPGDPSDAPF